MKNLAGGEMSSFSNINMDNETKELEKAFNNALKNGLTFDIISWKKSRVSSKTCDLCNRTVEYTIQIKLAESPKDFVIQKVCENCEEFLKDGEYMENGE